ncbi:aldehyde dehydrogenase family protein [Blastococcus capsensis]|uniref:aldehyde dehydrogenase family protein n=1 Tax=Blastococcus capsensis TaxID=1564163 RepID=UPI002541DCA0|nr:aldehyde dehydrogenase family protein [Blastococcus capsensis]MDK3258265.1 aldehyde dehydrogenase family protein [Blastococcus capsensis]
MIRSSSPQNPDDLVLEVPTTSPDEVEKAVQRARSAQRGWGRGPAAARATALAGAAEAVAGASAELADLMVREVGKPLGEAQGEVARAVAILRYYAQQVFDPVGAVHEPSVAGLLYTRRRPLGVAGLITPWNFPLAIPLWKAAPALAFGNAVVIKPAPQATAVAVRLAELLATSIPEDLFAVVPGEAETGRALVAGADVVSFTGSTAVGRSVVAAATEGGVPVQAEMGGQNPAIVLPDADVASTAAQIAAAAMGFAGQKCTATKRVIVVGDPAAFRDALVAAVEAMVVGDPADAATTVGPVIEERARDRVADSAAAGVAAGGRLLTGGARLDRPGWFVGAAVLEEVPLDHPLSCEEVFGPIVTLHPAATLQEAVELANGVEQGLVAAVYTRDLAAALAVSDRLEAGLVKVNAPTTGVDFYLPFGGEKSSSVGLREQGKAAQDFYTSVHTVTLAPGAGELPFGGLGA